MDMVSKKAGVASIAMGEITRGWEAIRTQVDEMVGSEGTLKLALGTIDVEPLAPNFALAFAPCTVTLSTEEGALQLRGAVTLLVEKAAGKWKVLHEHSSAQIPETPEEGD
jgi:ketosteroid isomerase-like protein